MRILKKPWLLIALIAGGTLLVVLALDRYQHRFVRTDQDLIRLLPGGDATVFFAQIDLVRQAGLLNLLAGPKTTEDADYQSFVRATGFDYSKDVDALVGSVQQNGWLLAVKGRFAWSRIRAYVHDHGGSCAGNTCHLPGSKPDTWVNLLHIQSNVLGIALGKSKELIKEIHPGQRPIEGALPSEPVWANLAPSILKNSGNLPAALRIFAIAMESANSVVIALAPPPSGSSEAFEIKLRAQCPVPTTADTIRTQLELETKTLRMELAHEHQQPNPADLTGLLTAGTFEANGKEMNGQWPVSKELLKTLQ